MKRIMFLIALMTGVTAAFADCTFTDVIVRQHWPWNSKVEVEMAVAGTGGQTHLVKLTAYSGSRLLGEIPVEKPVECDSRLTFTFDSTKIDFLKDLGAIHDFRVVPSARQANVLYMDIDLTKAAGEPGQVTYITEEDIRSGDYGEFKQKYWDAGVDEIAWTGVTKDDKYKKTHLVMRRIPAGTFKMGSPAGEQERDADERLQTDVTLTRSYYVGVFEVTEGQWNLINNGSSGTAVVKGSVSYGDVRGSASWPTDRTVGPDSWIGKLRTKTGIPFDLPTEAQWEKAARAGTGGVYYDGTVQPDGDKLNALAWTGYQPSEQKHRQNVGLLLPNNYGLYDVLGNVAEFVLDFYAAASASDAIVDPVGPASGLNRVYKGAGYNFGGIRRRLADRADNNPASASDNWGFRLALPAQW